VTSPGGVVRAAGGVVWRRADSTVEIAVVGRPRYGDWSLPKGKLEPGEPALAAAIREVREETGVTGVPQVRLPSIQYLTAVPGVEKSVDFWSMRVVADHGRAPDEEIAEVRWTPVPEANAVLTYAHDRGVVAAFAALPPIPGEVLLVRHAQAISRKQWHGPDAARPLDESGQRQARQLARLLAMFGPARVVSASPLRCQETVLPLGLPVEVEPRLDEALPAGLDGARQALLALAGQPGSTVLCSQGKVIPPLLACLRPGNATAAEEFGTPKGGGWLLASTGDRVVAADRLVME
jgi:8-oxo-dGTP pyrophosphatase MutT (NUDIX family)